MVDSASGSDVELVIGVVEVSILVVISAVVISPVVTTKSVVVLLDPSWSSVVDFVSDVDSVSASVVHSSVIGIAEVDLLGVTVVLVLDSFLVVVSKTGSSEVASVL